MEVFAYILFYGPLAAFAAFVEFWPYYIVFWGALSVLLYMTEHNKLVASILILSVPVTLVFGAYIYFSDALS